jgi:hypothetical protein
MSSEVRPGATVTLTDILGDVRLEVEPDKETLDWAGQLVDLIQKASAEELGDE